MQYLIYIIDAIADVALFITLSCGVTIAFIKMTGQTPYGIGKEFLPKSQKPSEKSSKSRLVGSRKKIIRQGYRGLDGNLYDNRETAIRVSGGVYSKLKLGSG